MKIINRKAYHEYQVLKEYTAGIQLCGSEVKSLRANNANITDAYVYISNNEVFIKNAYISKYNESSYLNHDERQDRKLLLHKKEINELTRKVKDVGMTIIPLEIFLLNGRYKVKIGLCKGKKLWDKRESLKEKDLKRSLQRQNF